KSVNALLGSAEIYIMNRSGNTIAASNYDKPDSFVGHNFSYRPYFQNAAEGRPARFFALGTTSGKRGYYFSSPVRVNGAILGVVVFKISLNVIEESWRGPSDDEIVVTDPEGIVFMSSRKDWLYRSFHAIDRTALAHTLSSHRYADRSLSALPVAGLSQRNGYSLVTLKLGDAERQYAMLTQPMDQAGWSVSVLIDTRTAHDQALLIAAAAMLVFLLGALLIAIFHQRRGRLRERMRLQRETQAELEHRVRMRTADLARANERMEREVVERRATERALRKMQGDLVQAGKLAALGQMSAALSHEFNQPLAALAAYADNAAAFLERGRSAEARDNIGRISSLIERLSSISRHLRSFARRPDEKLRPVALADAIKDALEIVAWRIRAADAVVETDLDPSVPLVMADAVRLQQVLLNLISTAADAMEGLAERTITIASRPAAADRVVIVVRDRGPGVADAVAERIFDPFFTTKGVGKGLGLGLSISYNIVKDFGGTLSVARHPDGGAVFSIELAQALRAAELEPA
ncbi:MAG: sensor histidine kinase, partial [Pararhizobium sp.]